MIEVGRDQKPGDEGGCLQLEELLSEKAMRSGGDHPMDTGPLLQPEKQQDIFSQCIFRGADPNLPFLSSSGPHASETDHAADNCKHAATASANQVEEVDNSVAAEIPGP